MLLLLLLSLLSLLLLLLLLFLVHGPIGLEGNPFGRSLTQGVAS